MDLSDIDLVGVDCIGLAEDKSRWKALVNAGMNILVP
jgi:hypothetical protein